MANYGHSKKKTEEKKFIDSRAKKKREISV
jgi:hypothetical protein